jgi:hypothetical protein
MHRSKLMNPLQYTSEEMFSSTELIRKSKMVFDKLHKNEIEKAIILRDGKPSFLLLDFAKYEKLMTEYLLLKKQNKNKNNKKDSTEQKNVIETQNYIEEELLIEEQKETISDDVFGDNELENALAQIEELNLDDLSSEKIETPEKNDTTEKEPLKEFWE